MAVEHLGDKLDRLHSRYTGNRWLRYFALFNRIALALGFFLASMPKLTGERFTALSDLHPMGSYLTALFETGYYYTFIGIAQLSAAILLLIPRTVVLGALLYFPIILNIVVLTFSTRFDGSLFSSPLMLLSNLFLLCWHYDKLKYILPVKHQKSVVDESIKPFTAFPWKFFIGVLTTSIVVVAITVNMYEVRPYNTIQDCQQQFVDSPNNNAGMAFCQCIHAKGEMLNTCLDRYFEEKGD